MLLAIHTHAYDTLIESHVLQSMADELIEGGWKGHESEMENEPFAIMAASEFMRRDGFSESDDGATLGEIVDALEELVRTR